MLGDSSSKRDSSSKVGDSSPKRGSSSTE